jgi:signal transduction histidine kinase
VHRPAPEQYNPPLGRREHTWRTALALLISASVWLPVAVFQWREARGLFWSDLAVGLLALGLSCYRRRWPLTVAVVTSAAGAISLASAGPGTLAAVSLATRRVVWQVVLVGVVGMAASMTFPVYQPGPEAEPWWVTFTAGLAFTVAVMAWGMYLGSRRELVWTLRDRADRAEAEQEARVRQGESHERARIAREMHDVLAHRISLITMHAGALAYRTDLTAEQMRGTAELIQAKAHEALTDLRHVLGVLRSDDGEVPAEAPQPTFVDVPALVQEAQQSGMRVQYDEHVHDADAMPEQVGRTTYRIVQEGLTNARKHAPDTAVRVSLSGSVDLGVDITIRNPARSLHSPRNSTATPGAGLGLVGLRERAKLAGGRLDGRRHGDVFELRGWLPWTR